MAWYLDATRIFPQTFNGSTPQEIARLQPLASGTVLHFFGYQDEIKKMKCVVIGNDDIDTLKGYTRTGSYYTLSGMDLNWGQYAVKNLSFDMRQGTYQSVRADLPCDSPVYDVDMELYKNE